MNKKKDKLHIIFRRLVLDLLPNFVNESNNFERKGTPFQFFEIIFKLLWFGCSQNYSIPILSVEEFKKGKEEEKQKREEKTE